jgi:Heavy metal associated domain 2
MQVEEARQAVDEVSQGVQEPGGAPRGRTTGPRRPTAVPRKTAAGEGARRQKPSSPAKAAAPVTPSAPDTLGEPLRGLRDCGITVKHAIPGRLRLRLHQMLPNEALAAGLPGFLALVPGVTSVEASTATGSLLITFISGDLAAVQARQNLAVVMHRFFPRLDTESLVRRMLGE